MLVCNADVYEPLKLVGRGNVPLFCIRHYETVRRITNDKEGGQETKSRISEYCYIFSLTPIINTC